MPPNSVSQSQRPHKTWHCFMCTLPTLHASPCSCCSQPPRTTTIPQRRWSLGRPNDHLRRPGGIMNFKGHRERQLSHEIEAVAAVYWGHFRRKMTVVEIIIAELHCLSNSGHHVDCSVSCVRDGRRCTK